MSIKDIAKKAGVSPSTVSRVLNNPNYQCHSKELRDKIWAAAIELNYAPNQAARNLKLGAGSPREKTFFINVLMTRMNDTHSDPFYEELLRVVESEIHRNMCILSKIWHQPLFSNDKKCRSANLDTIINTMYREAEGRADGLVIIGKCNKDALKKWQGKYKNIVSINRNSTNYEVDEVICDGRKIAIKAVEYLISLGHERIAYVGECHNETRYKGYVEALNKHNIDVEPEYIIDTKQTEVEGYEAVKTLSQLDDMPTGIYCANDITAIGMLKYLNKSKRRHYTPSIISSDDIEEAQNTNPMLTTIRLPRDEMGRLGIGILLDRMRGGHKSVAKIELEGKLIVRNSCNAPYESGWSDYVI